MDFAPSPRAVEYVAKVRSFMDEDVIPNEGRYHRERAELGARGQPNTSPPVMDELRTKARGLGLWNLFLPAPIGTQQPRLRSRRRAHRPQSGARSRCQ